MADTTISLATSTTPVGTDLVPFERPGSTVPRNTTVEAIIKSQIGGDPSTNTIGVSAQDVALGEENSAQNGAVAIGHHNTASFGAVAIGRDNTALGSAYMAGGWAIGINNNCPACGNAQGRNNNVLGFAAAAYGEDNTVGASANEAAIIGMGSTANGAWSACVGKIARTRLQCQISHGHSSETHQTTRFSVEKTTIDATPTVLKIGGANNLTILANTVYAMTIKVIGCTSQAALSGAWIFHGAIKKNNGTTALIGSVVSTLAAKDAGAAAWDCSVAANDALDSLEIIVTGAAGTTINWAASVDCLELTF